MRKYDGNTGRYIHIPDPEPRREMPRERAEAQSEAEVRTDPPTEPTYRRKAGPPPNQLGGGLQKFLSNLFSQGFETEDLLLFAVLFLMYQETKDKELLIIMGGMFLL